MKKAAWIRTAILVGAVSSPTQLGKPVVPKGCEHVAVTQRVAGRVVVSTVTRQPGPPIDGVVEAKIVEAPHAIEVGNG